MRRHRTKQAIAGGVVLGLAIGVIIRSGVLDGLPQALLALGRLHPEVIVLTLALSTLSLLISGTVWSRLLARLGHNAPTATGLIAFLSAGLGGMLVSAAGPAIGCTLSLRRYGVCPARAVLLTLMGNALGFCAVLLWAPFGLLLLSHTGMDSALPLLGRIGPDVAAAALVGLTVAMLVVLRALAGAPQTGNRLARRLLGRHAHAAVVAFGEDGTMPPMRMRHLLALLPLTAGSWLATTLALYSVLGDLAPAAHLNMADVIGSVALAGALGSLAFFVPDGMGVRDGVLIALLVHATGIPVATCTAAAILMRTLDPVLKLSLLLVVAAGTNVVRRIGATKRPAAGVAVDAHAERPRLRTAGVRLLGPVEGE